MALPKNMDAFTTALHKLPQKKIAYVISMLLIVYIALVFAKMTWRVVPDASIST